MRYSSKATLFKIIQPRYLICWYKNNWFMQLGIYAFFSNRKKGTFMLSDEKGCHHLYFPRSIISHIFQLCEFYFFIMILRWTDNQVQPSFFFLLFFFSCSLDGHTTSFHKWAEWCIALSNLNHAGVVPGDVPRPWSPILHHPTFFWFLCSLCYQSINPHLKFFVFSLHFSNKQNHL